MHLPDYFEFTCPSKTASGNKALDQLATDLSALNAVKPLIITEKSLSERGVIRNITNAFKGSGLTLGIYDGVNGESGVETIKELTGIYNDKGFDSIIAAGGGKVADISKILNIVVSGAPADMKACRGKDKIEKALNPFIYVPTSAGDGMETSREARLGELFFSSFYLMPNIVAIDPRMLVEAGANETVDTAMTALAHCVEAYTENGASPLGVSYAHTAIRFVMDNLLNEVEHALKPKGRLAKLVDGFSFHEERVALANAAVMGGYVYSNLRTGLVHRLGCEISRFSRVSQGDCMALILPCLLEYRAHVKGEDLEKVLVPVAGIERYCATPPGQRFESAMGRIRDLVNELYILTSARVPRTLEDAGVSRERLDEVAALVAAEEVFGYGQKELRLILEHAFEGKPVTEGV